MSAKQPIVQYLGPGGAQTASGNSGALSFRVPPRSITFLIIVSAVSGTTPTLDVYLQTSYDLGTQWNDFGHFAQASSVGAQAMPWSDHPAPAQTSASTGTGDAVLAANMCLAGPINPAFIRVKWVIGGTTPSFNFQTVAIIAHD